MITAADIRNLTSRDAVKNFLAEELGYQVSSIPFDAKGLGIPDTPAQFIRETELLCNYQQSSQIFQVYFKIGRAHV